MQYKFALYMKDCEEGVRDDWRHDLWQCDCGMTTMMKAEGTSSAVDLMYLNHVIILL